MELIQYNKLYDRLDAILLAHRLIGRLHLKDIYVVYQDDVYNGRPGYYMFVDSFKWSLSSALGEFAKVNFSSMHIADDDVEIIKKKLKGKNVKTYSGQICTIFEVYFTDLNDDEIEFIGELTDLYLSLKK